MKVLSVLNPILDDYAFAGTAVQAISLGKELKRRGIQVDYVANKCIYELISKDEIESKVYVPENIGKRNVIKKTIEYACNIYKSGNYDIMHINIQQMSVLDSIVNLIPEYVNVVYTQHTSTILGRFSLGYRNSANYLSTNRKNCRIVMVSKYMRDKVWTEYTGIKDINDMKNVRVIYSGVEDLKFDDYYSGRTDTYLSVGRIDPNKRMKELAEFCNEYGIKVKIVGNFAMGTVKPSDDVIKYYEEFKDVCKNSKYVEWIKYLPHDEVISEMRKSKGYFCFSRQESGSLTTIEALSTGTPVFYIEKGSVMEELVDDGYISSLIQDTHRKKWSTKMVIYYEAFKKFENMIENNPNAYISAKKRFELLGLSLENSADNYIKLYNELLSQN
jgi:glycosyltransferase involved in cell wall biosynthesis